MYIINLLENINQVRYAQIEYCLAKFDVRRLEPLPHKTCDNVR